eukprot:GEMP01025301.1.p1 GENE.GEMP01025301.1~~GEMP01025301.1.p1  ORF type:complete len:515 (+),score=110.55 GEMP01025301.1:48-1592(+)
MVSLKRTWQMANSRRESTQSENNMTTTNTNSFATRNLAPNHHTHMSVSGSRGSKTQTIHLETPEQDGHDPVFDPVNESPSTDSVYSGSHRKRKFTTSGVAQPRKERFGRVAQVRQDLFHTFEEVQDYLCDFRFQSEVIDTRTMPKFCNDSDFSRSNFFRSQNTKISAAAAQDGLIVSDRWALNEMFRPSAEGLLSPQKAITIPQDDPILLNEQTIPQDIVIAQKEEEVKKVENEEALFLRRHLLISNDLYTDAPHYKHGTEGAEKAVQRDAVHQDSHESLVQRVEHTFAMVKKAPVHPVKKDMKVKRIMQLVPNKDLWAHPYAQMKFDEPPSLPEERNDEIPSIIYKATPDSRLTAFAVFQHQKETGHHELEKSYAWNNQQEGGGEQKDFLLLDWPENDSRNQVLFSKVSNKIRLKKLTARVQKQRTVYQKQVFGTDAIKITWRNPTNEEEDTELKEKTVLDADYVAPCKDLEFKQIMPAPRNGMTSTLPASTSVGATDAPTVDRRRRMSGYGG